MNIYEMNIYEKLSAITTELQTVAKNLTVQTSKNSSYKAVSERDILDAVKPLEDKYGVYSYPVSREIVESNLLESESEYNGKITKKTTFMTRVKTIYRFVNIHNPTEYIETVTFAEGIDSQDKGSGKAMTYADKYALMKAYKISTGDDPDVEASKDEHYTKREGFEYTKPEPKADAKKALAKRLKEVLSDKGIDVKTFCADHGITKDSTEAELRTAINLAGVE